MEFNKFKRLCYEELRPLHNIDDKIGIMSIFLFAMEDDMKYARLLYNGNDHIFKEWEKNEIEVNINFGDNVKTCYDALVLKLIEEDDKNGYFKALNNGDEYAIAIYEICNTVENCNKKTVKVIMEMIKNDITRNN